MIAVLQRVTRGTVRIDGVDHGTIDDGLVIFLGVMQGDAESDARFLADKISNFRIFSDKEGKMNLSIRDVGGKALSISQFTLCGDWRKGNRPSFTRAADPERGNELYEHFNTCLENNGIPVETGVFGAGMEVSLVNDGPVTFVLDSTVKRR